MDSKYYEELAGLELVVNRVVVVAFVEVFLARSVVVEYDKKWNHRQVCWQAADVDDNSQSVSEVLVLMASREFRAFHFVADMESDRFQAEVHGYRQHSPLRSSALSTL